MSVPFVELEGSPTISDHDGRVTARRVFKVAWSDIGEFVAELRGVWVVAGSSFAFFAPLEFPGLPGCFVTSVDVEPFQPGSPQPGVPTLRSETNSYADARITAHYRYEPLDEDNSRKPGVPRGTFLTYSSDLGSERMTPPGRTWRWSVDGQSLDDDLYPSMLIPCEDISLAWRRVPLPPWDAIRLLRGRVNSQNFMGRPPGTVLFLGARTRRDFQIPRTGQSPLWRIDYHFKVRSLLSTADGVTPRGWNCLYRGEASSGEHWLEIEDASGHPPYVADDFSPLFQFGQ